MLDWYIAALHCCIQPPFFFQGKRRVSVVADHSLPDNEGYKMRCAELMVLSDISPHFPSLGMPTMQE